MSGTADWLYRFIQWFFNTSVHWSANEHPTRKKAMPNQQATNHPSTDRQAPKDDGSPATVNHRRPDHGVDPALPNDRDESVGITGKTPPEEGKQAHRDVERGVQDTSRGAESEQTYEKLKR